MGTNKRRLPATVAGGPKERHRRAQRPQNGPLAPVPASENLVARPPVPKSKHHSYFEFVENKEKKKKLEFENTLNRRPPEGFEFVPVGNPELTHACKELSRTRGVKIFIVSNCYNVTAHSFANQMNRVGYHFHKMIVQEAAASIFCLPQHVAKVPHGVPEPIPRSQRQYHSQVDAALRDLFPRIPNTDRQLIIEHAFTRGTLFRGGRPVGLCDNISLARRVQLAVLAHIRHTHTRYDELLRQTSWNNARKAVESLCLDILVKWRGDEETGRDQLDEILREVVVISDSEDDESEEEFTDDSSVEELDPAEAAPASRRSLHHHPAQRTHLDRQQPPRAAQLRGPLTPFGPVAGVAYQSPGADRVDRRGFRRYRAWEEAIRRNRDPGFLNSSLYDVNRHPDQHVANRHPNIREARPLVSPAGNAPTSNGYVPHNSPAYQWLQESAPTASGSDIREEINPVAREQPSMGGEVHRQLPQVGNHFQDMLVRSIEPASPDPMYPRHVRHVPIIAAGAEDEMEHPFTRHGTQYHPGRAPTLTHQPRRDEYSPPSRRVISDHLPYGRTFPGNLLAEGSQQTPGQPGLVIPNYRGSLDPFHPVPSATARAHGATLASDHPATDRIVVNASRPGTRLNPILMEDRGGFYERVEVNPIRRSDTFSPVVHSRGVHEANRVAPNPWEHSPHAGFEQFRLYGHDYGQDSRPVSGGRCPQVPQPYKEE